MALKAYKHLTDGEVKLVESGSAEETALLADTVKGASYLQLTSAGHAQEVAAAQGTALWVDVTSDLGSGGGSSVQEFEVTDLTIPIGTDWVGGHVVHTFDVDAGVGGAFCSLYLELDEAPASDVVQIYLRDEGVANPFGPSTGTDDPSSSAGGAGTAWGLVAIAARPPYGDPAVTHRELVIEATDSAYDGPTTEEITIARARASFFVI